jgi:prepilin peptidase CpaA
MNLVPGAPIWLLAILFAALVAAAIEDFIRLRISNVACLVVFVTALIAMGLHGFPLALWENAVVFAVLLVCGTLLFAAEKVGGGDVKLLASLGLWVNISAGTWLLATSLICGGVLAVIYIVVRYVRRPRGSKRPKESKGIPYGLAIVAGACLVFAGQVGLMKSTPDRPDPLKMGPLG